MFRIVSLILLSVAFFTLKGQNNLIIVHSNGTPFILYINDKRINDSLQSIVKVQKIITDTCQVKIIYANKNGGDINKKVYLIQNGNSCHDLEFTYAIENIKGKEQLQFISINHIYLDSLSKKKNVTKQVEKYRIDMQQQLEYNDRISENYPLPSKCNVAISDSLLNTQVYLLKENHIGNNRMKDAKWFITHNCLSVSQFEKVLLTFEAERAKENLAEFGYDYLLDKTNFLNITKIFPYRTEQELLKTFYNKKFKP